MDVGVAILASTGLVLLVFHFWKQLEFGAEPQPRLYIEFAAWAVKGILAPFTVWLLINLGVFPGLPILLRSVAVARAAGGGWVGPLISETSAALVIICSFWAGISFVYLLYKIYGLCNVTAEFRTNVLFWTLLLAPLAVVVHWIVGFVGGGITLTVWLLPVTHVAISLLGLKKVAPAYSKATALLKRGKVDQAEWAVIHELEKCENDFDGWMLLAELYALHFHDLAAAEQTIYDICRQPETNASQICTAVYKLSDWHLKSDDPESARRVLEVICAKWPDTQLERMARLRIQQIPASRAELLKQRHGCPIALPGLQEMVETPPPPMQTKHEAASRAAACVEQLKLNPNNVELREEFARLLAERLEKVDVAIDQVNLLLEMPDQPEEKRAEWLSLVAGWQLRYRRDTESGKEVLRRLIEEYPNSVQAFTAQRRLNVIAVEERMKRARAASEPALQRVK